MLIITGHYGSGKTEFAVNYAMKQSKEQGEKVALIDLDIVNPYFRSREKALLLEKNGIEVLGSSLGNKQQSLDMPALPGEINKYIEDQSYDSIFDVGGDGEGARVLSRFSEKIKSVGYEMLLVVNANRPMTATSDQVIAYLRDIENQSRLRISGLINNTHMIRETTEADIMKGYDLCMEVSAKTGLPVVFNVVPNYLKIQNIHSKIDKVFILDELYMRPEWM
ncbi:MAG: hypothetical protein ACC608_09900 [Anaerofustis sp.]